jgi:hypothetical protein
LHDVSCSFYCFIDRDQAVLQTVANSLDDGQSAVLVGPEYKLLLFLRYICVSLRNRWTVSEQFISPSYGRTVTHIRFLRILRFQTGTMLLTVMNQTVIGWRM